MDARPARSRARSLGTPAEIDCQDLSASRGAGWAGAPPVFRRRRKAEESGGTRGEAVTGEADRSGRQPEGRDRVAQTAHLILQRMRGRGGLFDQRRVLLRHLVHLADRAIHLFDARALLA